MSENSLRHKDVWAGEYRGVSIEIVRWYLIDKEIWNYYLLIHKEQLPESIQKMANLRAVKSALPSGRKFFEYTDSLFADLKWHGGITFYEKLFDDTTKEVSGYKVGCDYSHSFDEYHRYNLKVILLDCKASVDRLWSMIPDMLIRCLHDGKYHEPLKCPYNNLAEYHTDLTLQEEP